MYEYAAEITRVVDGDTVHARLDLGIDVRIDLVLRLAGINAPELGTADGLTSRAWLATQIEAAGRQVIVRTSKDRREKYGRYLAELFVAQSAKSLNAEMVELGLAVTYAGRT